MQLPKVGGFFIAMATSMSNTVTTVLQMISDLRGESSTNTDAVRIRAISRANQDFAKRKPWSFYRRTTTTTGDGTSQDFTIGDATYHMRPKGLSELFVAATTSEAYRYGIVEYENYLYLVNSNASAQIAYQWYDVANDAWKVHINPVPANADTITYTYFWIPTAKTATTDTIICPSVDIIVRLANAYIYEGEDEDKYIEQLQIAEQMIADFEGKEEQPAVGQTYTFSPSMDNTGGIGTY